MTLDYGNSGIFHIMGNAGSISSTVALPLQYFLFLASVVSGGRLPFSPKILHLHRRSPWLKSAAGAAEMTMSLGCPTGLWGSDSVRAWDYIGWFGSPQEGYIHSSFYVNPEPSTKTLTLNPKTN